MVPIRRSPVRTVLAIEPLDERCLLDAGGAGLVEYVPLEKFASLAEYRDFYFDVDAAADQYRKVFGRRAPANYYWFGGNALRSSPSPIGLRQQDYVRVDGGHIFLAHDGKLLILDASVAGEMTMLSEIDIDGNIQAIYLQDGRLTVVSQLSAIRFFALDSADSVFPYLPRGPWTPLASDGLDMVKVSVFDVTDLAAPVAVEETFMDGYCRYSTAVGAQVYVVVGNSLNGLPHPSVVHGKRYEREHEYRERVGSAMNNNNVLPWFWSMEADGDVQRAGPLSRARQIYRPELPEGRYNGRGLVTVASFDIRGGVAGPEDTVTLASSSWHIEITPERLYLFGPEYLQDPESLQWGYQTRFHQISLEGPNVELEATIRLRAYVGSNAYVDEADGILRVVASSYGEPWQVFLFDVRQDAFELVGHAEIDIPQAHLYQIGFLPGHAVFATSNVIGYSGATVVVIDLTDPTAPSVSEPLELPGRVYGFVPLDDEHMLLATDGPNDLQTRTFPHHVSVLEVSGPNGPELIHSHLLTTIGSPAVYQFHLVSFTAERSLLVYPVHGESPASWELELLRVDLEGGFEALGTVPLEHEYDRHFFLGDVIYTLSWTGIKGYSLVDNPALVQEFALPRSFIWWRDPPDLPRRRVS